MKLNKKMILGLVCASALTIGSYSAISSTVVKAEDSASLTTVPSMTDDKNDSLVSTTTTVTENVNTSESMLKDTDAVMYKITINFVSPDGSIINTIHLDSDKTTEADYKKTIDSQTMKYSELIGKELDIDSVKYMVESVEQASDVASMSNDYTYTDTLTIKVTKKAEEAKKTEDTKKTEDVKNAEDAKKVDETKKAEDTKTTGSSTTAQKTLPKTGEQKSRLALVGAAVVILGGVLGGFAWFKSKKSKN